jgi:hypothetical protein
LNARTVAGLSWDREEATIRSIPHGAKNTSSSTAAPNCMIASNGPRPSVWAIWTEMIAKKRDSSVGDPDPDPDRGVGERRRTRRHGQSSSAASAAE